MVLIEDDVAELFNDQVVEFNDNDFIVRSNIDRDEVQYEKFMFDYLPKQHKKLYNEALICELFGQKN